LSEILIAQHQRDGRLLALGRKPFANGARFFEINVPRIRIAGSVFERESIDGAAIFDGVFAVGFRGGEGARDFVKGGGGGEGVWGLGRLVDGFRGLGWGKG
jgi:hypothetical protein